MWQVTGNVKASKAGFFNVQAMRNVNPVEEGFRNDHGTCNLQRKRITQAWIHV